MPIGLEVGQSCWLTIPHTRASHPGPSRGTLRIMDSLPPRAFLVLLFAGWVNRPQQAAIDYLLEENRVLRAAHGRRRLRLTDDDRRRLAVKWKVLGRRRMAGIVGIVTPDTILLWYRTLVAKKYDGSRARRPGRPRTKADLAALVVRLAQENPTWGYTRIRYFVFFVMKLKSHRVAIAGIAQQPDESWMMKVARNLTAAGDGFLNGI